MNYSVLCVLMTGVILGLDAAVVSPSMAKYMESLGGSREDYGYAITAFYIARFFALPVLGLYVDSRPYMGAFLVSFVIGAIGGFVYAFAPAAYPVESIILSRVLLGASSAVTAIGSSFLGTYVKDKETTKYIGLKGSIKAVTTSISPVFNLLFVALPTAYIGGIGYFTSYTYCGYFIMLSNLGFFIMFYFLFSEPERSKTGLEEPLITVTVQSTESDTSDSDDANEKGSSLIRHVLKSGAWISYLTSFQNNFVQQAVQWTIPLITEEAFHWGQLENGLLFTMIGVCSILATTFVSLVLSSRFSDRRIYLSFQMLIGLGVACFLYEARYGITQLTFLVSIFIYFVGSSGQVPSNLGLYVKLIGKRDQGKAQAVLQMIMCFSRALSGQLIGHASATSMTIIWVVSLSVWASQFPFLIMTWPQLSPRAIRRLHNANNSIEIDD